MDVSAAYGRQITAERFNKVTTMLNVVAASKELE